MLFIMFYKSYRTLDEAVLDAAHDLRRLPLGRECYPGGKCVASELGMEHTLGQKIMSACISVVLVFCFLQVMYSIL